MKQAHQENDTSKAPSMEIKNTPHIKKIFHLLEVNPKPLSVEQIYILLKSNETLISLSTVYRILERLSQAGLVQKWHLFNEEKVRFTIRTNQHRHYFICLRCHAMIELPECPINAIERVLEDKSGIQVTGHQLEIYGYCSRCH